MFVAHLVATPEPAAELCYDSFSDAFGGGPAIMEENIASGGGMRRHEDIALDLMKFVAAITGYGKTGAPGVGFQGGSLTKAAEEYAGHLLELYSRCLDAVQAKK
jgi:hypothetical protein